MNILFVGSGTDGGTIIRAQGESLRKSGILVDYFFINKGGIKGYLQSISRLRSTLNGKNYDLIHSHYLLSAIISSVSSNKPHVVSLMGSDVFDSLLFRWISIILHFFRWKTTIVKSDEMKDMLNIKNIHVIPNGVDLDIFLPINQAEAREHLGWEQNTYILFGSNPERKEKNFELAEKAFAKINIPLKKFVSLKNIPHEKIKYYLNACDVMLLTSFYEGSPNIVKEAMACNCPVVTTEVGDVKNILGDTEGCYITGYEEDDVANKIMLAINYRNKHHFTEGRKHLVQKGLDSNSVAARLKDIYKNILDNQ